MNTNRFCYDKSLRLTSSGYTKESEREFSKEINEFKAIVEEEKRREAEKQRRYEEEAARANHNQSSGPHRVQQTKFYYRSDLKHAK